MKVLKKLPYLAIVLAATLWGIIGLFIRYLNYYGIGNIETITVRSMITSLSLIIYLFIKDREKLKINLNDVPSLFGMGVISFVFFNICYLKTMSMATLSFAAILLYTAPIFVTILGFILFKEKITQQKIIALILAFVGCALVSNVFDGGEFNLTALIFGLLSGFGYGLYSIFGKFALRKVHSLTATAYAFLFASVVLIPFTDFKGIIDISTDKPVVIFLLLALGILQGSFAYILYTWGLSYVESSKASIIASVEPVVASLVGVFVFKEDISFFGILGIIFVIFALSILSLDFTKKRQIITKLFTKKQNNS